MNVLVVAGGTGGHFYPGLAVVKELVKRGNSVRFLVRTGDMVIPMIERDGFSYSTIQAGGFQRKLSLKNILTVFKLSIGILQSFFLFLGKRPDVVLAMGGYLSIPASLAAKLFGVPVILHEQNVKPGLANRVVARWAETVLMAFAESSPSFPGEKMTTGNPVRPEFLDLPDAASSYKRFSLNPAKKTLLVFGGSLGARRLNDLVTESLALMVDLSSTWQVLHVTGTGDDDRVRKIYEKLPFERHVTAFCHDMAAAYAAADFVVCRAGASSVSELAVLHKPALLVPYPYASENHQWANANVLKDKGAAQACAENELRDGVMNTVLSKFLHSEEERTRMAESYKELGVLHRSAALRIADVVTSYGAK